MRCEKVVENYSSSVRRKSGERFFFIFGHFRSASILLFSKISTLFSDAFNFLLVRRYAGVGCARYEGDESRGRCSSNVSLLSSLFFTFLSFFLSFFRFVSFRFVVTFYSRSNFSPHFDASAGLHSRSRMAFTSLRRWQRWRRQIATNLLKR